jgi:hypothetical protein
MAYRKNRVKPDLRETVQDIGLELKKNGGSYAWNRLGEFVILDSMR